MTEKTYIATYRYKGKEQRLRVKAASDISARAEAQRRLAAPILSVKEQRFKSA